MIDVIEVIPYVKTRLERILGTEPLPTPLDQFIAETMEMLRNQPTTESDNFNAAFEGHSKAMV